MSLRPLGDVLSDYRRDPDTGRSYFEVGPGADRFPGRTLEEYARDAARLLVAGYEVRWMPGDHTVYMLGLSQPTGGEPHLVFTNASFPGAIRIPDQRLISVEEYVRSSAPLGGWMGLRPLLHVLTGRDPLVPSVFRLRIADAHDEAKARVEYAGHQPFERSDADLGRKVRLLVAERTQSESTT